MKCVFLIHSEFIRQKRGLNERDNRFAWRISNSRSLNHSSCNRGWNYSQALFNFFFHFCSSWFGEYLCDEYAIDRCHFAYVYGPERATESANVNIAFILDIFYFVWRAFVRYIHCVFPIKINANDRIEVKWKKNFSLFHHPAATDSQSNGTWEMVVRSICEIKWLRSIGFKRNNSWSKHQWRAYWNE